MFCSWSYALPTWTESPNRDTLQYYTSFPYPSFVILLSSICPRCGPVLPIYFTSKPAPTPTPTSLSVLFIKPVCPAETHARLPARLSCQTRLQNGKLYFTLTDTEFTTCFTKRSQIRGLSPTQEKTTGPLLIWHVILITAQVCMIELMLAPACMWRETLHGHHRGAGQFSAPSQNL